MSTPQSLPPAGRAVIPRQKLEGYILNPQHEVGRHKARVFASALGIRQRDWEYLRDQLRAGIAESSPASRRETPWGHLNEAVVVVAGLIGETHPVMTVWLVESEDDPPRLVTAYVADQPPRA
jgi:hypothetical protein